MLQSTSKSEQSQDLRFVRIKLVMGTRLDPNSLEALMNISQYTEALINDEVDGVISMYCKANVKFIWQKHDLVFIWREGIIKLVPRSHTR